MASSTPKKTTQKIAKAAPIPQSTPVNLTPTDVKNLVGALSNTKDEIKINYEGMRRALGLRSTSSASKIWSRLRKKLFAEEEQGEASATPDEAVGDGNDGNDDEEENDDEDIDVPAAQVPTKKRAAAKRRRETEDDDTDAVEDDAGVKPAKKARSKKST